MSAGRVRCGTAGGSGPLHGDAHDAVRTARREDRPTDRRRSLRLARAGEDVVEANDIAPTPRLPLAPSPLRTQKTCMEADFSRKARPASMANGPAWQ